MLKNLDTKTRMAIAIPAVIAILVVVYMFLRLQTNDPAHIATLIVKGYRNNDPDRIYQFATEIDKTTGELTKEKFAEVWNEIAWPTFQKGRFAHDGAVQNNNDPPTQGSAEYYFEFAPGKVEQFSVSTYQTEAGPKSMILYDLLLDVWQIEFLKRHSLTKLEGSNWATRRLEGLRRDRATLEKSGLKGVTSVNGSFMTWDHYEKWLKKHEAEVNRSN